MPPRFELVRGPEPTVTFIPAPHLVVRRLADGGEMGHFPTTSHRLARKMAQRWRGRVEIVTGTPVEMPNGRPSTSPGIG